MLDSFSWSLGLLIWKMGILLIAMPVHRNSRDEMRRAQPIVGPQGGGGWQCSWEGAEGALGPGCHGAGLRPLANRGQCRLVPADHPCVPWGVGTGVWGLLCAAPSYTHFLT